MSIWHLDTRIANGKYAGSLIKEIIDKDPYYWFNYLRSNCKWDETVHDYFCNRCPELSYRESKEELLRMFYGSEDSQEKKTLAVRLCVVLPKGSLRNEIIRIAF